VGNNIPKDKPWAIAPKARLAPPGQQHIYLILQYFYIFQAINSSSGATLFEYARANVQK
jgi:hypothetical protein